MPNFAVGFDLASDVWRVAVYKDSSLEVIGCRPREILNERDVEPEEDARNSLGFRCYRYSELDAREDRSSRGRREISINETVHLEEDAAVVIRWLKGAAECLIEDSIIVAVISVPRSAGYIRRQRLWNAAKIAGISVPYIVNRDSAAVLWCCHTSEVRRACPKNVVVFDTGGRGCEISLLSLSDDVLKVRGSSGAEECGDDRLLPQSWADMGDTSPYGDCSSMWPLEYCSKAKISDDEFMRRSSLDDIAQPFGAPRPPPWGGSGTGSHFRQMDSLSETVDCTPWSRPDGFYLESLANSVDSLNTLLADSRLTVDDVDEYILIGEWSGREIFEDLLRGKFAGRKPSGFKCPDEVVVRGAAIHAAILSGSRAHIPIFPSLPCSFVLDLLPFSLGFQLRGTEVIMIQAGTQLPCLKKSTVLVNRCPSLTLHIYELRTSARRTNKALLGSLQLDDFSGCSKIEMVTVFCLDRDGILRIISRLTPRPDLPERPSVSSSRGSARFGSRRSSLKTSWCSDMLPQPDWY